MSESTTAEYIELESDFPGWNEDAVGRLARQLCGVKGVRGRDGAVEDAAAFLALLELVSVSGLSEYSVTLPPRGTGAEDGAWRVSITSRAVAGEPEKAPTPLGASAHRSDKERGRLVLESARGHLDYYNGDWSLMQAAALGVVVGVARDSGRARLTLMMRGALTDARRPGDFTIEVARAV